jgi:hypothetical protein
MHRIPLLALLASGLANALEPLPEGPGLARHHPGDKGMANHPAVLLAEDFEAASLADIKPRWNEVENRNGQVLELVNDHPPASSGSQCLQVTATLGENTGGHLFKRLDPGHRKRLPPEPGREPAEDQPRAVR